MFRRLKKYPKKYRNRYIWYTLLIVFLLAPTVAWIDYWFSAWGWTKGSVEKWDAYVNYFSFLILGAFGTIISYVFASGPKGGKADAVYAFSILVIVLLCMITDFWFWVIGGIMELKPPTQWFPPENMFPRIIPWRWFGIAMTTSLHLKIVAIGSLLIVAITFGFIKLFVK